MGSILLISLVPLSSFLPHWLVLFQKHLPFHLWVTKSWLHTLHPSSSLLEAALADSLESPAPWRCQKGRGHESLSVGDSPPLPVAAPVCLHLPKAPPPCLAAVGTDPLDMKGCHFEKQLIYVRGLNRTPYQVQVLRDQPRASRALEKGGLSPVTLDQKETNTVRWSIFDSGKKPQGIIIPTLVLS